MTNGFVTIARSCGIADESLEGAISWLQNTPHSWLLIIDNADNENLDLARFLPAGRNGSILITTRLPECAKYQTVGKADGYERLSQETAIELLLKACGVEAGLRSTQEEDARAVAELLGCHALAVIQAGAAISQNLCSLGEYRDVFLSQRQTLLECAPKQAQSEYGGVYATFEVSASYLKARNDQIAKDALQLLNFYAFMHFTDFPEALFEEAWKNSMDEDVVSSCLSPDGEESSDEELNGGDSDGGESNGGELDAEGWDGEEQDGEEDISYLSPWHVSHLPTFMRKNALNIDLNKICLRQAISLLASLSLVTFDSARGTTRMHPVSHFWSKDRLQKPEESTKAGLNGLSVLSLSIRDPYATSVSPLVSQLQPHIESIAFSLKYWDFHEGNFPIQQSVYQLGWVMFYLSSESALFELLQMIPVQADESWIRSENGQLIQELHGRSMRDFGDANEAVILLERVYEEWKQTLGAKDPRFLRSQHELSLAYMKIEDTAKALELLERIVRTRRKTLSPEDPRLLASQHELARAYMNTGETAKAIVLLESVVEIEAKTLRPEHPERLNSQHTLALAYLDIGETDKAITLLEAVVEIRTKTLRPEHPERLLSQHELARAYLNTGETDKAITLLEAVVEIKAKTPRADHPSRVSSIYVLAQCHHQAGNYERALELAKSIENVAQNRPGDELADWNAELIGFILEEIDLEEAS